jgi:signal transduction histidine kinase
LISKFFIGNEELVFQNDEKEKRAAELAIANEELVFQNDEKEKRAIELIIANKELAYQNKEKEKRAIDLIKINLELKKAQQYQKEYINGLEHLMFITSHKVRQPIANILGLSLLLEQEINSPNELKEYTNLILQSALVLDSFTQELTEYISNLGEKGKNKIENK